MRELVVVRWSCETKRILTDAKVWYLQSLFQSRMLSCAILDDVRPIKITQLRKNTLKPYYELRDLP